MTGHFTVRKTTFSVFAALTLAVGLFWMFNMRYTPQPLDYIIEKLPATDFNLTAPALPDLTLYTPDQIQKRIPKSSPGQIENQLLWDSPEFKNLQIKEDVNFIANRQDNDDPFWIVLRSGVYNLQDLYIAVNNESVIQKTNDGYLVKAPILIDKEAGLIVQNTHLYLSTHDGAMVTSYGRFYAFKATITSWDTLTKTHSVYDSDKNTFRPYLQFLNDSETYIAESTLQHLGYNSSKGFGLSFTANTNILPDPATHTPIPMTGWIVNSTITDLYYGYYSFMARGLVVVGNTFKDNIIYGIDPHDYSSELIIAKNEVFGTKKKHGIIISRSVNHSYIIQNNTHKNKGSGIMLDRQCSKNVIAYNQIHQNNADGIFFSESPDNLSYQNEIKRNKRSGIRLRNSSLIVSDGDQIIGNNGDGVTLYTADLSSTARDMALDPYEQKTTMRLTRAILSDNGETHIALQNFDQIDLYNLSVIKTPSGVFLTTPRDSNIPPFQSLVLDKKSGVRIRVK